MTLLASPPDITAIRAFFQRHAPALGPILEVTPLEERPSEQRWHLRTADKTYVLHQAVPDRALGFPHPAAREFQVLSALRKHVLLAPKPILYCEDPTIVGAPFYLLELPAGIALQSFDLADKPPALIRQLAAGLIDQLIALHSVDIEATGLTQLGHAEGYTERQVQGWINRYRHYQTDSLPALEYVAQWLAEHLPVSAAPTLLHNDYGFDHLYVDPADITQITGITGWKMATVGDPLVDVGTILANWTAGDKPASANSLATLAGQPTRQELVDYYGSQSGHYMSNILFYYVLGIFKNAVTAQHYCYCWKQQHLWQQPGILLSNVVNLAEKAERAIKMGRL